MRKRIFGFLQYFFFLGAGLFLVWWQLKSMTLSEKEQFFDALSHANYWIVIPIAIMSMLSHISRSMRWKLLMQPLGYTPKISNLFLVTMVGYLANSAVPRLGEVIKCTLLAKYEKLKVDKLIGTIIVERSFDIICYILFIGITILIQINVIAKYLQKEFSLIGIYTPNNLFKLMAFLFSFIAIWIFIKQLFKKYKSNKIINKISNFINGIIEGFHTIKKLKEKKLFLLHTLFIWSMYLGQIYLGFKGLEGTKSLGLSPAFSVLTLTTLSMIITPGGIGSFPIFVMQSLLIYGINENIGSAFGWLMWGVSTGLLVIVGFISLLLIPYFNKSLVANHESTPEIIE